MLADNRMNVRNKADKSDRINLFVTLLKGCLSIFSQLMVTGGRIDVPLTLSGHTHAMQMGIKVGTWE